LPTTSDDSSVRAGIEIFKKALQAPARQIITNAGLDTTLIVNKLFQSSESDYGYDVMTGHYGGMFALRITDSFKVTKVALSCASSLAVLVINSNVLIADSSKQTDFTSQRESF
ncbi:MAG: TCP-1/cpn60 chaperonin family protein, partial [Candidatus Hodgkinia cicadicola]